MAVLQRERTPEMRKGRVVLTRRDPYILKLLAGLDIDGINIDDLLRFGKEWWAARNDFLASLGVPMLVIEL